MTPHDPNNPQESPDKIVRRDTIIASISTDKEILKPRDLANWLNGLGDLAAKGFSNVRVYSCTELTHDGHMLEWIRVKGDRLETDEEFLERQADLKSRWQLDYERYLADKHFYEGTERGRARVRFIEEHGTRPIRRPSEVS